MGGGRARDRRAPRDGPARARRHDLGRGLRAAVASSCASAASRTPSSTPSPSTPSARARSIAEAGRPGAVTIATNMAGRGVDIKLGGNPEHLTQLELAKLGLKPGDPDYDERFKQVLPSDRGQGRGRPREGPRGRRPVHLRHRAPRVAPDRQPAARPLRPPGRPRRVALLPLRRGRPRAPVRRRPHLPHPRPPRPRQRGGRGGADRGEDALEADRGRPAQGRGAELPHPQARARVRRRHEPAARDRLPVPRRGARGPRHGPGRARGDRRRDRPPGRRVHARRLHRGLGPRRAVGAARPDLRGRLRARRDRPARRSTARSSSGCWPRTRRSSTTSARRSSARS